MSHKPNVNIDPKSESDRLGPNIEALASNYNDLIASSTAKQTHHHHHHHHHHNILSEIPKEETKSHKIRNSNFHSLSQHSQAINSSQEMQSNNNSNNNNTNTNLNQRYGQQNMTRSTTNPLLYQYPPAFQHVTPTSPITTQAISSKSSTNLAGDNFNRYATKQRASSSSMITSFPQAPLKDEYRSAMTQDSRQDQQDKETNEVVTMIKEELEDNLEGLKDSELENLGSLERNLPVELSFLIRQQAYCMARMNYLDRQIRELKETRQTNVPSQANSSSVYQSQRNNMATATTSNSANNTNSKNGNFIPSDDSGGEYSRATDEDELSSLLDHIAKSVRSERNINPSLRNNNQQQQQQQARANYSVTSNPPQPQYTIINPTQLHHQAVPVFVMGSPITLAHPSSISSNVLPGVHFQPQAPYNQYYEEFYAPNNSSTSTIQRPNLGSTRLQQFDNSMSAIEQLVSQKEKRQIKSQLKSADNWLKMRSSNLCNQNGNYSNTNNGSTSNGDGTGSVHERNPVTSSAPGNSSSVIEENRSR